MKTLLLNPGPVNLSETVRQALLGPDLCHREPEYFEMQQRVRDKLLQVYGLDPALWASVMLSGSGTAAMEAMLSSMVPRSGHLLVLENGVYGERLSRIAELHGIRCTRLRHDWLEALDTTRLERLLGEAAASPDAAVTHLALVHHETTTGRLNDLDAVAGLCRQHGVRMLVDGVSSFGAEALAFDQWPVDAVAATANKCLHGIPGLAFVVARRDALARACQPPRSLYLDLAGYLEKQDALGTPFTPAVTAYYALDAALDELAAAGGWRQRHERYLALAEQVRAGLARLGVTEFVPASESSCVLRAYRLPEGFGYDRLHDQLKTDGFVIYAGQGAFGTQMFRISTMGEIERNDIARLLTAMQRLLKL